MDEIIQIDEDTRLRVVYDEDAEDPREWGDHITDDSPELRAWRDGEVYGVIVEKRTTWQRVDMPETTMVTWDETDSLWGCYLTDEYTARDVAREYFGIG